MIDTKWRRPKQPHPGTRVGNYRCSLPGLAEFTTYHCEGTAWATTASAAGAEGAYCAGKPDRLQVV